MLHFWIHNMVTFCFIIPEALSGISAALGFIFALVCCRFALEKPCAKACCALPSMIINSRALIPTSKTCPYLSLHRVALCGSLVRHAKTHFRCVPLHCFVRSPCVGILFCLSVLGFALRLVVVLRAATFRLEKCFNRLLYYYRTIV